MKLKEVKCVIFDMDGVIFDSESLWAKAFYKANEVFNYNFSEEVRKSWCGRGEQEIRDELAPILNGRHNEYRDYICNYVDHITMNSKVPLKEGFFELINNLKNRNIKIGLATSSIKRRAVKMFNDIGIDVEKEFDSAIFTEDVICPKPNPEIFIKVAQKIGVSPKQCIVLEDSITGITGAINGGFNPCFVIDLTVPSKEIKEKCVFVANDLYEVNDFINQNM